jgi:hypothetical protein
VAASVCRLRCRLLHRRGRQGVGSHVDLDVDRRGGPLLAVEVGLVVDPGQAVVRGREMNNSGHTVYSPDVSVPQSSVASLPGIQLPYPPSADDVLDKCFRPLHAAKQCRAVALEEPV